MDATVRQCSDDAGIPMTVPFCGTTKEAVGRLCAKPKVRGASHCLPLIAVQAALPGFIALHERKVRSPRSPARSGNEPGC